MNPEPSVNISGLNQEEHLWLEQFLGFKLVSGETKLNRVIYVLAKRLSKLEKKKERNELD